MADSLERALEGIRVVALEQAVAMPFCTLMLAALGAEVIKVEAPDRGDVVRGWDGVVGGLSTGFVAFNAGKRDITVDVKHPKGRRLLRTLIERSDVFVENFAPGVAARLGLAAQELRAVDPRLIYCSLSGYGQDGPYSEAKAYDLLVQGESGLLLTNGTEAEPAKVGIPVTDQIAGAHAALAIVAALQRRERSGAGAYLDVSMLESTIYWLAYYPHHWWHGRTEPPRSGMRHQYLCPYGPFPTADGQYVNVVVASDSDWKRFCQAMDRTEWVDDPRFATVAARREHRAQLDSLVEETTRSRPLQEWEAKLRAVGLPYGRVRSIPEVLEHPQVRHRELVVQGESPIGPLPLVRFPLARPEAIGVPGLGDDSDEILAELGYDAREIAELRDERVV
jgi:crotonobetainyl-CoA:carnitine CoA-transferase CaiB-like acyl-CoA transferase